MMLLVLVLRILRTAFGFIFFKLRYSILCLFVSFSVFFIMYFIVHAAFVRIKLMTTMMMPISSTRI